MTLIWIVGGVVFVAAVLFILYFSTSSAIDEEESRDVADESPRERERETREYDQKRAEAESVIDSETDTWK
jgi:Na+-transporting methylmalonyl-CoA/oxaloacetate decarboxylase gamma subunit